MALRPLWIGLLGGLTAAVIVHGGIDSWLESKHLSIWILALVTVTVAAWGIRVGAARKGKTLQRFLFKEPTPQQIDAAHAEIAECLTRPLSRDEAIQWLLKDVDDPARQETLIQHFDSWYQPAMSRGWELWEHSSSAEAWLEMRGMGGFALVDHGRVVDAWVLELN